MDYKYEVLSESPSNENGFNYIEVKVSFAEHEFTQLIISNKKDDELKTQLDTYSKEYYESYMQNINSISI